VFKLANEGVTFGDINLKTQKKSFQLGDSEDEQEKQGVQKWKYEKEEDNGYRLKVAR
jgi:hypothetical protein